MFNVAVINLKNLLKNILKIIIVSILITMIFKFGLFRNFGFKAHLGLISNNIRIVSDLNNEETNIILSNELFGVKERKDDIQLAEVIEELEENENEEELDESQIKTEDIVAEFETIEPITNTQVIAEKNKKEVYTNSYGSVKVKNESKYQLTEEMLMPTVDFNNKQDILIFHTHTCESYTQTPEHQYVATSNYRTTDQENSVVHIGTVLTDLLSAKGYNVRHNKTYHDYPSYTGSYNRSYQTVSRELSDGDWTELVIDLHRDAIGNGSDYGPTVSIDGEVVAQLMFVIGTDGGGLEHPNWLNNFKLAVKIQEKANELYPGLFRPIILRNSRYNQNLAAGACIIEVGATGNTLEECEKSMKFLSNVISEVMK